MHEKESSPSTLFRGAQILSIISLPEITRLEKVENFANSFGGWLKACGGLRRQTTIGLSMLFKYFFTVQTSPQIISSQPPYSLLFKKEKRWMNDVAGKSVDKWRTCDKMGKHGAANTGWETFVPPLSSLQRAIVDFPTQGAQIHIIEKSGDGFLFCEQDLICCRRQSGGCRRHFGDSQWRQMASTQIKVLWTTDISCWQKHRRSWFKANFSSKTARASVCIGNYQFCPHWQTGYSTGLFAWGRGGEIPIFVAAPPPVLNSQWRLFPRQRRETLRRGREACSVPRSNQTTKTLDPTKPLVPTKQLKL